MNHRDEKILLVVKKKQLPEYGHLVPFCIIQKAFPWVDGAELTSDLLKLDECDYFVLADFLLNPLTRMVAGFLLSSKYLKFPESRLIPAQPYKTFFGLFCGTH